MQDHEHEDERGYSGSGWSRRRLLTNAGRAGLAFALLGDLSACGAGASTSGGGAPPVPKEASDFLRQAGKRLGGGTVNVLQYASPQSDAIAAVSSQFTDLTGIQVNWTKLDEESASTKAAIALGSGQGSFDVVQSSADLLPTYASRGWLQPISDLRADSKLAVPGWDENAYGKAIVELLNYDGKLYAAPMFLGTQLYYYRTDIFEKNGISAPPKTFAELADIAHKIHRKPVPAIALRTAASPSQIVFVWTAWLYGFGGKYFDSYDAGKYHGPALASHKAAQALELFADLTKNYAPSGATNWTVEDVVRAFSSGQVAICQEGAVFGGTFNNPESSRVAGKVGTFEIPAGPAGNFLPYTAHGWVIAKGSKHSDAAALFAQWATLKDTLVSATQSDVGFAAPPLASVYGSAPYRKKYGFDSYVKTVKATIDDANNGHVSPLEGDPHFVPGLSNWAAVGQEIARQLNAAVTGQVSASRALARAQDAMARMVKD